MQPKPLILGIDVAKAELVIARCDQVVVRQIANDAAAIDLWLHELPEESILAMESTGTYHRLLAERAHATGMHVYVLNARDVFFYAKALGARGKTDRVDAALIARYAAEHHSKLYRWQPAAMLHDRLEELLRRRALLVTKRDAVRQTLRSCSDLSKELSQLDLTFEKVLRAIDEKVKALFATDSTLAANRRRLANVVGFGPLGSALLAVLLARIPFANADALVAYSGMDPRPDDSGRKKGKRRLSKRGPAFLRRQWYLAGFAASHTKATKALYQALRAKGFSSTEAFLILGRKLLRAAFAVWKTGLPFDAAKLQPKMA